MGWVSGGEPARPVRGDDFASVLRWAIAARNVSLEQLRRELRERGATVSVATLSYWQSGRSKPERATSVAALRPLEEILGLPRGFLTSRLGEALHAQQSGELYALASLPKVGEERTSHIDAAVAQLGMNYDDLTWVSVHDRLRVDARGVETSHDVRLVLQARHDGVDRYPVWLETDDATFPVVTAMTNCRVGRVREFAQFSGVAVEMRLARPLRAGETMLVEHRQGLIGPRQRVAYAWRQVASPSRDVVIEVGFDDTAVPTSACMHSMVGGVAEHRGVAVHPVIQGLFVDNEPGCYGVAWTW